MKFLSVQEGASVVIEMTCDTPRVGCGIDGLPELLGGTWVVLRTWDVSGHSHFTSLGGKFPLCRHEIENISRCPRLFGDFLLF